MTKRSCAGYLNDDIEYRQCETCERVNTKSCYYPDLAKGIDRIGSWKKPEKIQKPPRTKRESSIRNQRIEKYMDNPYSFLTERIKWAEWNDENVPGFKGNHVNSQLKTKKNSKYTYPRHCDTRMKVIYIQKTDRIGDTTKYVSQYVPIGNACLVCGEIVLKKQETVCDICKNPDECGLGCYPWMRNEDNAQ